MGLYAEALSASTLKEMNQVLQDANEAIGNRAPIEQEEFVTYGYAEGWLDATYQGNRKLHEHMMEFHPDYRENYQNRWRTK